MEVGQDELKKYMKTGHKSLKTGITDVTSKLQEVEGRNE